LGQTDEDQAGIFGFRCDSRKQIRRLRRDNSLDQGLDLDGATNHLNHKSEGQCKSEDNLIEIEPIGLNIGGEFTGIPVKLMAAPKNFRGHADLSNLNKALLPTEPLISDVSVSPVSPSTVISAPGKS
jgi:hypothetical protein